MRFPFDLLPMRRFRAIDILTVGVLIAAIGIAAEERFSIAARFRLYFSVRAQIRAIAQEWQHIDSIVSPSWSPVDTGPLVIEALQYSCGGCIEAAPSIRSATAGVARLGLLHIPRDGDSVAVLGASLSICASAVGAGHEMHDYLVSTENWHSGVSRDELLRVTSVERASSIYRCLESEHWKAVVDEHRALASRLQITFTPYFFGRTGATIPSSEGLAVLIDRERGASSDTQRVKSGEL